jgi:2-polyprenyl-6-methoxyphenol hydroxylase-like FAD-dependent oxidoreductase
MARENPKPADEARVVVIGAGPVGCVLALELARHGVPSTVVDRLPQASRHPKMDYVSARSMELLRRLGLGEELRSLGVPADHPFTFLWMDKFADGPLSTWTYDSPAELAARMAAVNDGSMPREPYLRVIGSRLEEVCRSRCRQHPLIEFLEDRVLTGFAEDASGVTAELAPPSGDGTTERIRGRFLVGCDGAGSTVRRLLDIGLDDLGPRAMHQDVYFRSTDPALRSHGPFFLAIAARGLTLVSRDGDQTWTGTYPLLSPEDGDRDPVEVIRERLGLDLKIDEVLTTARWEGRLTVADSYRKGSVFLAGDAAHQFFPTGGHGANTGLGDAIDLGWKLAAALHGWGGPTLLDSYEAERRPTALFNREMCFNLFEVWRRFPVLHSVGADREQLAGFLDQERYQTSNLGIHFGVRYAGSPVLPPADGPAAPWDWARITPAVRPGLRLPSLRLADGAELFDLLGPGFTLLDSSGSHAGKPLAQEAERLGLPLLRLPVADAAARRLWGRDLVLVRPDQHVAWLGDSSPADCGRLLRLVAGNAN